MNKTVSRRLDLIAAWCGVWYTLLLFIGWWPMAKLIPMIDPSETPATVAAFFQSNHLGISLGMVAMMWAAMLFLPFASLIGDYIAQFEGNRRLLTYTFILSGFANAMYTFYPAAWWASAAFRPDRSPDVLYFVDDACWLQLIGNVSLIFPMYIVPAIVILNDHRPHKVFPRWVGYFNILVGLDMFPDQALWIFHRGAFAWNGLISAWLTIVVFSLWFYVMFWFLRKAILASDAGLVPTSSALFAAE